ncbi:MAG: protein kinase, partial [Acidobacteriota bacterium]
MTKISLDPVLENRFLVLAELSRSADAQVLQVSPRAGGDAQILEIQRASTDAGRLEAAQSIVATSRHPGLASVTELGALDRGFYWLREDLGKVSFESLLAEGGPVDVATALELLDQAFDALQALHAGGFWVRNLAPSDLYLRLDERSPRVVLGDLGLGHSVAADGVPSATAVFVGRLRHASPEQFEDESKVSSASDIYAMGLIAFELMTGHFPIHGDTPSSLIAGHLFRPPLDFEQADPEGRVPELVRAWILARLAKNPDERGDLIGVRRALSGLRASAGAANFSTPRFTALRPSKDASNAAFGAVDQALESGDLTAARRLVETLREEGPNTEVEDLARRVAAVEGFTYAADVHRLVSEAQGRLASGAPSSAVGCLEEARRLVP